jgi:hypothetical protein
LRKLYPGVKCKLIYRKDVASLGVKYGLFDDPDPENPLYNPHPLTLENDTLLYVDGDAQNDRPGKDHT